MSKSKSQKCKIDKIEETSQLLTSRGGISFFAKFLESSGLIKLLVEQFDSLTISSKGLQLESFLKQMFGYFVDGTKMNITYFDTLKENPSLGFLLGIPKEQLASSHQIKRFFRKFHAKYSITKRFRYILRTIFIWRLQIEKPSIIEIGIDTMVLDNNDAPKREGVEPTYKKVLGFQPLQLTWNGMIIDALFREGNKHSNHGNDAKHIINQIVKHIRKHFTPDIPIIIKADAGFMDNDLFTYLEENLKVLYIVGGKKLPSPCDYIQSRFEREYEEFQNGNTVWNYIELGNRLKSWNRFRRLIYTQVEDMSESQLFFSFHKSDQYIYTNIGVNCVLSNQLREAVGNNYLSAKGIIQAYHARGAEELVHRSFKDFIRKEQLPFQDFGMNQAYYFLAVIGHSMLEAFKRDVCCVCHEKIYSHSYPTTVRRQIIDIAGKIVSHSNIIRLKVANYIYKILNIKELWVRCLNPVSII